MVTVRTVYEFRRHFDWMKMEFDATIIYQEIDGFKLFIIIFVKGKHVRNPQFLGSC